MKFIYIKNYLNISRAKKNKFIEYIYNFDDFRVESQKVILDDNLLILELDINSSKSLAKEIVDKFFENDKEIKIVLSLRNII